MSCPAVIKVVTPGPPGPAGPAGPAGVGAAWQQGSGAPGAGVGADGDFYLNTDNGDIYGPKAAGAWGAVIFNIAEGQQGPAGPAGATGEVGPAGAAGVDGRTVLSGSGAPGAGVGENGDFFIDTTGWVIYGPKAGGAWPGGASLVGPAGGTGATGPTGPAGAAASVNVGSVTTGAPGSSATVTNTGTSSAAVLSFSIPRGDTGATGAAATIAVGTVNTGAAGSAASVSNAGSSSAAVLNFTIPRGDKGDKGDPGDPAPGTDLSYDAATREVRSSTGDDATLPLVTSSTAGLQPASGYDAITYAAQVTLDFAALNGQMKTGSLTGDLELLSSNLANGQEVRLRLVCDATQRTLTFPTDWKFVGTKPANIAASKVAILSLAAFGATNADVVAAYAVQS